MAIWAFDNTLRVSFFRPKIKVQKNRVSLGLLLIHGFYTNTSNPSLNNSQLSLAMYWLTLSFFVIKSANSQAIHLIVGK